MLTKRQQVIAKRFIIRQIQKMNKVVISNDNSDDNGDVYDNFVPFDKKKLRVLICMIDDDWTQYDEDAGGEQYCAIIELLGMDDKSICVYKLFNRRLTLTHWEYFCLKLNNVSECESCESYFDNEEKNRFCDGCDPYVMEYEDDCAICLTNRESVWIKTSCGHCFHRKCFKDIPMEMIERNPKRKCPLCRLALDYHDNITKL
jgi:NADH pyrophosphatase NudC (nudix superfamily)